MEELKALLAAQNKTNQLLDQLIVSQKETMEFNAKDLEEHKEVLKNKDAQFERRLAKTRELAQLTQVQFFAFMKQSNKMLNVSVDELAVAVVNSRPKERTLSQEDQNRRDREGTDFYKSYMDRIVGQ